MKPIIVSIGNQRIPAIHIQDCLAFTDKLVIIDRNNKVEREVSNYETISLPVKKEKAITKEDLISLGYEVIEYADGYIHTNPNARRSIRVNLMYVGYTLVTIKEDGSTRIVFRGHIRSLDELKLILDLVL